MGVGGIAGRRWFLWLCVNSNLALDLYGEPGIIDDNMESPYVQTLQGLIRNSSIRPNRNSALHIQVICIGQ